MAKGALLMLPDKGDDEKDDGYDEGASEGLSDDEKEDGERFLKGIGVDASEESIEDLKAFILCVMLGTIQAEHDKVDPEDKEGLEQLGE